MAVVELYSQRRKRELGLEDDVYQYVDLSAKFRQQVCFIIESVFGALDGFGKGNAYTSLVDAFRTEFGRVKLTNTRDQYPGRELIEFVRGGTNENVLDVEDLTFRLISHLANDIDQYHVDHKIAMEAVEEINTRFRQNSLGFSFEGNGLIRIDSHLLHKEVVQPALSLLSDPAFVNANNEFRSAHEHWRNGHRSEVLVDCGKAFESTMRIIADKRGWVVPAKPTASVLVKVMLDNNLVPPFYQNQMAGLRTILETGIPTPRNQRAGHGAGAGPAVPLPEELVKYVLHQTAATIVYLVEAEKALP